ncbi:MAG: hypothetical protein ONB13_03645, partial [candidate division KSB1 bacterium]|nr:hypothetical protein [candidate division KSB1 bacterium]
KGIPFTYETPILELASNEKISCFMIAKKGRSKTHVKWRPVANVSFTQEEKGFIADRASGVRYGWQISSS